MLPQRSFRHPFRHGRHGSLDALQAFLRCLVAGMNNVSIAASCAISDSKARRWRALFTASLVPTASDTPAAQPARATPICPLCGKGDAVRASGWDNGHRYKCSVCKRSFADPADRKCPSCGNDSGNRTRGQDGSGNRRCTCSSCGHKYSLPSVDALKREEIAARANLVRPRRDRLALAAERLLANLQGGLPMEEALEKAGINPHALRMAPLPQARRWKDVNDAAALAVECHGVSHAGSGEVEESLTA